MKTQLVLFVLIISSIELFSQNEDQFINPFWDFYSSNYLNTESAGRGFTGIAADNDISGITMNPASVNIPSKFQLNFQYTYKTSNPWLKRFVNDVYIKHQLFSGSIGFGYQINKQFQTGLIYNNPTGTYYQLGKVFNEFGNELFDYYANAVFHSFNIPFIFNYKHIRLGALVSYNYTNVTFPSSNEDTVYHTTNHFFRGGAGIIYVFNNNISLGLKMLSGGKSEVIHSYPGIFYQQNPDEAVFPWKFGAGIKYTIPESGFDFLFDYNLTWHNMENLKERHDFHAGIQKTLTKEWIIRGGLFTLLDYRSSNVKWLFDPIGEYNQYFLTLGLGFKKKNLDFNLALLTSEISPGIIKTTYINGGLTFNFK